MVRHLSTGTGIIVALMAAHRLARDQSENSSTLDEFFRQETARLDDFQYSMDELGKSCKDRVVAKMAPH